MSPKQNPVDAAAGDREIQWARAGAKLRKKNPRLYDQVLELAETIATDAESKSIIG
jgi:hypothetical protein